MDDAIVSIAKNAALDARNLIADSWISSKARLSFI